MKKFALMIAALGLCAGSLVACGGDDVEESKAANGESCSEAADCASNFCGDDGKCADAPAGDELPECEDNGDCENHAEGKFVCNVDAGVCVECLADNVEDAACDSSKPGPICVANACAKCTEDTQCGENRACDKESGACVGADLECSGNDDCKEASKPYCVSGACVAENPAENPADVDPCAKVTCEAGTCDKGVCVTDDMKALTEDASCDPATFQEFCLDNGHVSCDNESQKVIIDNCTEEDAGTCTIVDSGYGKLVATCAGNADMLARCDAADANATTVNVCYGVFNAVASVFCVKDVFNKTAVVLDDVVELCEDANPCGYDADGAASCKAAE